MIKELQELGFSEKEARVYITLIKEEEASAPKIATFLNIDRRTIYDIINSLFQKGYISRKKVDGREIFSAVNPEIILEDMSEKLKSFKEIIPSLLERKKGSKDYQKINILYGPKAVKILVNNALKTKSEIFLMGRGGYLLEQLGESQHQYIPKLKELNWKMIQTKEYKGNKNFTPKKMKYLPNNIKLETAFLVFEDKLYLFSKKEEIMIIEIIGDSFADTFKTYFKLMWGIAK